MEATLAGLITVNSMRAHQKEMSSKAIVIPTFGSLDAGVIVIEEWDQDDDDDDDDYHGNEEDQLDDDDGDDDHD